MLLPKSVKAAAFDRLKLSAGVVVAVATLVVNSGERLPALKLVTVPVPPLLPTFAQVFGETQTDIISVSVAKYHCG